MGLGIVVSHICQMRAAASGRPEVPVPLAYARGALRCALRAPVGMTPFFGKGVKNEGRAWLQSG